MACRKKNRGSRRISSTDPPVPEQQNHSYDKHSPHDETSDREGCAVLGGEGETVVDERRRFLFKQAQPLRAVASKKKRAGGRRSAYDVSFFENTPKSGVAP